MICIQKVDAKKEGGRGHLPLKNFRLGVFAPMALEAIGMPEGTVRFSFGPLNRDGDVECILKAVDTMAAD